MNTNVNAVGNPILSPPQVVATDAPLRRDDPVSLVPLDPMTALKGLMAVKPERQGDD